MILNTNVQALLATKGLWQTNNKLQKASTKLSLGTKINKSGDEPAGLAVANKMRMELKGIEMADRNVNDAISLIQTAEGGVAEMQNMAQRLRELAVQASTDAMTDNDRSLLQLEVKSLVEEIDAVSQKIQFNKKSLLNEDYETFTFQVGSSIGQELAVDLKPINSAVLGISLEEADVYDDYGVKEQDKMIAAQPTPPAGAPAPPPVPPQRIDGMDLTTITGAQDALVRCDKAIERISIYRANMGANQNKLEKTSNSLIISQENTHAALSRVIDTDMASEMSEYTKNNVLVQAGIAMLSQANQRPNQLLSLLK